MNGWCVGGTVFLLLTVPVAMGEPIDERDLLPFPLEQAPGAPTAPWDVSVADIDRDGELEVWWSTDDTSTDPYTYLVYFRFNSGHWHVQNASVEEARVPTTEIRAGAVLTVTSVQGGAESAAREFVFYDGAGDYPKCEWLAVALTPPPPEARPRPECLNPF